MLSLSGIEKVGKVPDFRGKKMRVFMRVGSEGILELLCGDV